MQRYVSTLVSVICSLSIEIHLSSYSPLLPPPFLLTIKDDTQYKYTFVQTGNAIVVTARTSPPSVQEHWKTCTGNITVDNAVVLRTDTGNILRATATDNCTVLPWGFGPAWCSSSAGSRCPHPTPSPPPPPPEPPTPKPGGPAVPGLIKKVHVVSMCHLDVGFTDTVAGVVLKYWYQYFPLATKTAAAMNVEGQPLRYVFTTHAWLVDLFFNCPPGIYEHPLPPGTQWDGDVGCPSKEQQATIEKAVRAGWITWHVRTHRSA